MGEKIEEIQIGMNLEKIGIKNLKFNAELYYFEESELEQLQIIFKAWQTLKDEILKLSSRKPNLNEVISEGALAYFMKCPRLIKFQKRQVEPDDLLNELIKQNLLDNEAKANLNNMWASRKKPYTTKYKKTLIKKELIKTLYKKKTVGKCTDNEKKALALMMGQKAPSHSFDCYDTKTYEKIQVKATIGSSDPNEEDLTSFDPYDKTVGLKFQKLYFLDFRTLDGKFFVYDIPLKELLEVQINKDQTFEQTSKIRPRFSVFKHLIDARKGRKQREPIDVYDLMKP